MWLEQPYGWDGGGGGGVAGAATLVQLMAEGSGGRSVGEQPYGWGGGGGGVVWVEQPY